MAGAAATFNALPTQMALLADALRAKLEAGAPPVVADTAAADTVAADTSAGDTQAETQD
jgi:large subunit ribosomal protein L10